jgi:GTP-binding protein
LINFFTINGTWSLVDLPGYGYAKVAKEDRLEFNTAVRDYLGQRPNLKRVFALIDSRLPPQEIDLKFVHWLGKHSLPFALVFTKIDKQAAQHSRNTIEQFKQAMAASTEELPPIFASSITTKTGRAEILGLIEKSLPKDSHGKAFKAPHMMHMKLTAPLTELGDEESDEL